jgi:hypothetical protein
MSEAAVVTRTFEIVNVKGLHAAPPPGSSKWSRRMTPRQPPGRTG